MAFNYQIKEPTKKPNENDDNPSANQNPIQNKRDLRMNKARVSIYLSGCDVHWYYKANVY